MKHISLSWKLFFSLTLFLLIPLVGWYGLRLLETQYELEEVKENQQLLSIYRGFFQKLIDEDKSFAQELSLEKEPNQVAVSKRKGPILVDGYADEWYSYQEGALTANNDSEASSLMLVEDENFFYGLVQIKDNHIVYQKDLFSTQSSDMLRLDLGYGYWLFKTPAPGRVTVLREYGNGFRNLSSILAVWQETQSGYVIEFRAPKIMVGARINAVLYDVDENQKEAYNDNYQGVFTFTNFSYFPLSREKSNDWLLDNNLNQKRLTITNKQDQVVYQTGTLFDSYRSRNLSFDSYQDAKKLDNKFTRLIKSTGTSFEQSSKGQSNFIARSGTSLTDSNGFLGSLIIETSLQKEKQGLQTIAWIVLIVYVALWLFICSLIFKQVRAYRNRVSLLTQLTEASYEEDLETIDLSSYEVMGDDEVSQLYSNLQYNNQRLEQRRDHQQKLLARLNHELRTPLAIIGSSIDNLALSELSEEDEQLIHNARSGLERLSLSFSRLSEANRLEEAIDNISLDWFELSPLLNGLVSSYQRAWPSQQFTFEGLAQKIKIRGSADLFAQMMDKIVSNAVDFSESDCPIRIEMQLSKKDFKLSISNTGPSIPQEKLKQIFNLMESNRGGQQATQSNLGLGLYIAKLIAKRHRAKIYAINNTNADGVTVNLQWNKKNFVITD